MSQRIWMKKVGLTIFILSKNKQHGLDVHAVSVYLVGGKRIILCIEEQMRLVS